MPLGRPFIVHTVECSQSIRTTMSTAPLQAVCMCGEVGAEWHAIRMDSVNNYTFVLRIEPTQTSQRGHCDDREVILIHRRSRAVASILNIHRKPRYQDLG